MPESAEMEVQRGKLHAFVSSKEFVRAPAQANLLSRLGEMLSAGEANQIEEHSAGDERDHCRCGCVQFESIPGLRSSKQPTAKRAWDKTSQEYEDEKHCLFIDMNALGQQPMNGCKKVER
jgi:hypothetical protein